MNKIPISDFNLTHTLECGQFFRYRKMGDWYYINSRDDFFRARQAGNSLIFEGVGKKFITNFFRLGENYERIIKSISKDWKIEKAISKYYGLRLIRQNPWECLISYMCSANSNIPRIKSNLEMLCTPETELKIGKVKSCRFPEPGSLKGLGKLKNCSLGFRAKYIFQANQMVTGNFFERIKGMGYEHAKEELKKIPGVGDKIADCVLLFSLGFDHAFPVDVWIKRVMEKLYFNSRKTPNRKISKFGQEYFGEKAGYANQFLYHWIRTKH